MATNGYDLNGRWGVEYSTRLVLLLVSLCRPPRAEERIIISTRNSRSECESKKHLEQLPVLLLYCMNPGNLGLLVRREKIGSPD